MTETTWDGSCPKCKNKFSQERLADSHVSNDYRNEFQITCEECHTVLDVDVIPVPEYGISTRKEKP
jgi:hypothetical protein